MRRVHPLVADGFATFRLARLVIDDTILDRPRYAALDRLDHGGPRARKLAEGLRCYWCVAVWCAAAVAVLRRHSPAAVDTIAAAAIAGVIATTLENQ